MSKPTAQAQKVINAMLAAGFARKEFSVRTETKRLPAEYGGGVEYGNARLVIYRPSLAITHRVPAMIANGLDVTIYKGTLANGDPFYSIDADDSANRSWLKGRPVARLTVTDHTTRDDNYPGLDLPAVYTNDARAWAVYGEIMTLIAQKNADELDAEIERQDAGYRARYDATA